MSKIELATSSTGLSLQWVANSWFAPIQHRRSQVPLDREMGCVFDRIDSISLMLVLEDICDPGSARHKVERRSEGPLVREGVGVC